MLADLKVNFSSTYKPLALGRRDTPLRQFKVWLYDHSHVLKLSVYGQTRPGVALSARCFVEFDDFPQLIEALTRESVKTTHRRLLAAGAAQP